MSTTNAAVHAFTDVLLTDLYEFTMAQAYFAEGMSGEAVFSLFVRRLPPHRNYLVACGLEDVLTFLERFRFDAAALGYLASLEQFSPAFLGYLERLRFTGDVHAIPEGTPVFGMEPLLEVVAPIVEGQLVETWIMNQVHVQTVLASKAARVIDAAQGREVVDFGLRRTHGADAGLKSARAFYVAGLHATSNVAAGQMYGISLAGTMAHSYVQAHASEREAFRAFTRIYPDAVLLVDTYDTIAGIQHVIELAKELGQDCRISGIRLDSGDLIDLSKRARGMLDEAGLHTIRIFASGSLDEDAIAHLISAGAPIDAFVVESALSVSADAPDLDIAYELVAYEGRGRIKLSPNKSPLPGQKQVFRVEHDDPGAFDVIARQDESVMGRPLLQPVMQGGRRRSGVDATLAEARARRERELNHLPPKLRRLAPAEPPYDVLISPRLVMEANELRRPFEPVCGRR